MASRDYAKSGGQEDARKRPLRDGLVAARDPVPQVAQCCIEPAAVLRRHRGNGFRFRPFLLCRGKEMVSLLVEAVSLACVTYFAVTPCKRRRRSVVRGAISGAALASNCGLTALRCCRCCLDCLRLRVGSLCGADHDQRRRDANKGNTYPQVGEKLGNRVEDAFRFRLLR
jgi:hypothetical protein